MEKQCAAVRVDGEGQGIRISLSGAVCQSTGPGSGGGTVGNHDALEQRTVRRTHKPAEGDQAPDVRMGEIRTSQSPCVALGGIGTSLKPAPRLRKTHSWCRCGDHKRRNYNVFNAIASCSNAFCEN